LTSGFGPEDLPEGNLGLWSGSKARTRANRGIALKE